MPENPQQRYQQLKEDAQRGGYQLNPDEQFCVSLAEGLLKNKERYGVEACPCRLVMGAAEENMDIVCPCDYRDDDLSEFGACFCALYVTNEYDSQRQIPDRRPVDPVERGKKPVLKRADMQFSYPVWRCSVCGYLCAHNHAPEKCPICKASKERFERFA